MAGGPVPETGDIRPEIGVYVPRPNTIAWLTIPTGSAMVVDPPADARPDAVVTCYFETWERHQRQHTPFATLVTIAGGRCHWRQSADGRWASYPTQSKASLRLGDLVRVGAFDDYRGEVQLDPAHEGLVRQWLGTTADLSWELDRKSVV